LCQGPAAAKRGVLSKGSYILWSVYFKRGDIDAHIQTWPDDAHRLDFRPQRNESRERMYERHRHAHEAKLRAREDSYLNVREHLH